MENGDGGKHDVFVTFLYTVGTFCAWCLRYLFARYWRNRDEAKERKREEALEKLLEEDIREHSKPKNHTTGF